MNTPVKSFTKFLSPGVLSPSLFKLENTPTTPKKCMVNRPTTPIKSSYNKLHPNITTPVKIQVHLCKDFVTDIKKKDFVINTPNKLKVIRNGIENENVFNILGRGSFGKVFKAVHKGSAVAMKLVKKTAYIQEKNALNLIHENIVQTLEVYENDRENYSLIIMEYLSNCDTLQSFLNNPNIFMKDLLQYAFEICQGLLYCHSKGILHLDIKPSNILISEGNIAKICDFGNSCKIHDNLKTFKHHGTILYTAPELLLGKDPTVKCDVYSLGILLWQIKTRNSPYSNIDNLDCVIYQVVKCSLRPDSEPPFDNLSQLYQQCWHENPIERPNLSNVIHILYNITP